MSAQLWKDQFTRWKEPPSDTEKQKAENAVRLVTEAVKSYSPLRNRSLSIFAQGSYRNRTNVRQESDVDVCVLCSDTFHYDLDHAPGASRELLGISPATYDWDEFKNDVHAALIAKFGHSGVTRGDKAFDVHENTYRISADAVPCFEYRMYVPGSYGGFSHEKGTVLRADKSGTLIQNYPEQHYSEGVRKHKDTSEQFKKQVRILKRLRHHLLAKNISLGQGTCSFLLESLVHNCCQASFKGATYYDDTKLVLADIWGQLEAEKSSTTMLEVNRIKYLFHSSQPWTLADARACIQGMWTAITEGTPYG